MPSDPGFVNAVKDLRRTVDNAVRVLKNLPPSIDRLARALEAYNEAEKRKNPTYILEQGLAPQLYTPTDPEEGRAHS